MFEETHDLTYAGWRMRIKNPSTLHHYVEELATQNFVASQSSETRQRLLFLARAAPSVIRRAILFLRSGVSPSLWPRLFRSQQHRSFSP